MSANDFPSKITIGDKYGPAMKIMHEKEAAEYFERCVSHCMTFGKDRAEAEKIERSNLGYYAGYYGEETRERVERLFSCAHPIFGSIKANGAPTPEAAFEAGQRMGEAARTKPSP